MSKKHKLNLVPGEMAEGLTEGQCNSYSAFRERMKDEKNSFIFVEEFFKEHGKMTEPDAARMLWEMGYRFDLGCLAARLDECRGDKRGGSLRKYGSKISVSTGHAGCVWGFVPPESKIERAQAVWEHWQNRLARNQKIKAKIDGLVERAKSRVSESERDIIAASFWPNPEPGAGRAEMTPQTGPQNAGLETKTKPEPARPQPCAVQFVNCLLT